MQYTLDGKHFSLGMEVLKDHGVLFNGLRPDQALRVARSNGLAARMPKTKEGMALLMYGFKTFKTQPKMWPLVKEIKVDEHGKVVVVMMRIDQHDLDKATNRVWTKPAGKLYEIDKALKSVY